MRERDGGEGGKRDQVGQYINDEFRLDRYVSGLVTNLSKGHSDVNSAHFWCGLCGSSNTRGYLVTFNNTYR